MQPTYMPWAGYLHLMAGVDTFVYLDDAQYERSSWQNRNRVLVNGKECWLTVPVVREHLGAKINTVVVDDAIHWRRKQLTLLGHAYGRHVFGKPMLEMAERILDTSLCQLAELNIALLEDLRGKLSITTPILRSSELGIEGTRTDRLIDILDLIEAKEYVTPPGALEYLRQDHFVGRTNVRLLVHNFNAQPYPEKDSQSFISHLSILDVVANLGWAEAAKYIRPDIPSALIYEEHG